jgi:DNA processing protein
MNSELKFQLALTFIKEVGPVTGKSLVHHFGSAEKVFTAKKSSFLAVQQLGNSRISAFFRQKQIALERAEQEILLLEKEKTSVLWFQEPAFPRRLLNCVDSPILLYHKGKADFNQSKTIGIVGTRKMTPYGRQLCEQLVEDLIPHQPLIISGLAFGIDIVAHRAALKNGLQTVAVVASGMNRMYPPEHLKTSKEIVQQGSILTEYCHGAKPDKENFPMRNRIVAGMCDAMIVVETAEKGGAMITAQLANGYNRDVFAFPGSVHNSYSRGCNYLIKTNQAHLIESAKDLIELMNWDQTVPPNRVIQKQLFVQLNPLEEKLYSLLQRQDGIEIDTLCMQANLSHSQVASTLLQLELQGIVQVLPGKLYKLS